MYYRRFVIRHFDNRRFNHRCFDNRRFNNRYFDNRRFLPTSNIRNSFNKHVQDLILSPPVLKAFKIKMG